jgi:hypothetical protein
MSDGSMTYVDGNALAGPLREVLAFEVTTAMTSCAGCGRRTVVGELQVFMGGPGLVARCPGCDTAVLRFARTPTAAYLDLRGTVAIEVPTAGG